MSRKWRSPNLGVSRCIWQDSIMPSKFVEQMKFCCSVALCIQTTITTGFIYCLSSRPSNGVFILVLERSTPSRIEIHRSYAKAWSKSIFDVEMIVSYRIKIDHNCDYSIRSARGIIGVLLEVMGNWAFFCWKLLGNYWPLLKQSRNCEATSRLSTPEYFCVVAFHILCCFLFIDKMWRQYLLIFFSTNSRFSSIKAFFSPHLSALAITDLAFMVVKN